MTSTTTAQPTVDTASSPSTELFHSQTALTQQLSAAPCYILEIPPELRQLLYEWLMAGSADRIQEKEAWPREFTPVITLSRTCKLLWQEGMNFMNEHRTYTADTVFPDYARCGGHDHA